MLAPVEQRRGVGDRFALLCVGPAYVPDQSRNIGKELGQALQLRLRASDKTRLLHQIARRITAKCEFRKNHEVRASLKRAPREPYNPVHIAGKIANRRVDLGQSDFHESSTVIFSLATSALTSRFAVPLGQGGREKRVRSVSVGRGRSLALPRKT